VGLPLDEFQDGHSVMLATNEDEWYHRLCEILDHPERRNELAANGLQVIRNRFSAESRVGEFVEALKS
jgi:spore maturation protein CgeB